MPCEVNQNEMHILIKELSSGTLNTKFGKFRVHYFTDGREDAIALVNGDIEGKINVTCRIHSECLFAAAFFSTECDCLMQAEEALKKIKENGGIFIHLFQNGRGNGLPAMIATLDLKHNGESQNDAYIHTGFLGDHGSSGDPRSYNIAAKIIRYFSIKSINLISRNTDKIAGLKRYGIDVTREEDNKTVFVYGEGALNPVDYARENMKLFVVHDNTVLVISDLNIDCSVFITHDKKNPEYRTITTGGCAFNAAARFRDEGLDPIIIGSVGNDENGNRIISDLEEEHIKAVIYKNNKKTGFGTIVHDGTIRTVMDYELKNANDYNHGKFLKEIDLTHYKTCFITATMFFRADMKTSKEIVDLLLKSDIKIVLDFVPHDLYRWIGFDEICTIFDNSKKPIFMLICETKTAAAFLGEVYHEGDQEQVQRILCGLFSRLNVEYLVLRSGYENIGTQIVYKRDSSGKFIQKDVKDTGFENVLPMDRIGYGEKLTAKLIKKYDD